MEFQVTIIEIGQAGMLANYARFQFAAAKKHWGASSMIGASRSILLDAATELGEGHQHYPIRMPMMCYIINERSDRISKFTQQISMCAELIGVRVETIDGCIKDPCAESGIDELSNQFELAGQFSWRIVNWSVIVLRHFF